jgi:hypothetical protein
LRKYIVHAIKCVVVVFVVIFAMGLEILWKNTGLVSSMDWILYFFNKLKKKHWQKPVRIPLFI